MVKFFLIVILIIMVLRSLARLLMPLMVKQVVRNAQNNMNEQYRKQQSYRQAKEGDVHLDYVPPRKKKFFSGSSKSGGDFVDYEEIK